VKDEGEVPAIDVSGGQGVQAGTGNVQYNAWVPIPPLDPVAMSELNPHAAVTRLQSLSHNELVDFFVRASADDVAELLTVFLEADEAKVVAVLADMNRRRSTELIKPLVAAAQWLASLPEAVEGITDKATALKWVYAESAGTLERFADGYVRKYKSGRVIWSDDHGAHAVSGEIEEFWTDNKELLDFPEGDSETTASSPFGTVGIRQPFEGITVYSSKHGVYAVDWISMECYEGERGSAGWLGFPIGSDIEKLWGGWIQPFEGGAIYSLDAGLAYAVSREVVDALPGDQEFLPVSKEVATKSSFGTSGTVQRFKVNLQGGVRETAVYSSEGHAVVFVVAPEVWSYYHELGGEGSWLGCLSTALEREPRVERAREVERELRQRLELGQMAERALELSRRLESLATVLEGYSGDGNVM
jgi:hypothetical protein